MKAQTTRLAAILAGGLLVLAVSCDESETVAPDGSTITLAASPATILLIGNVQDPEQPVNILATLRNSIGVPLPGQDVRFTQTSGVLTPQAGIPVTTDDLGNALTVLTLATQNTTITAQSGKAMATLSLQSVTCNISSIALSEGQLNFDDCTDEFELTATVTDTSGDPCVGVKVTFDSTADQPPDDVQLTFGPGADTTDEFGIATTMVGLVQNPCEDKCQSGVECNSSQQQILATVGTIESEPANVSVILQ